MHNTDPRRLQAASMALWTARYLRHNHTAFPALESWVDARLREVPRPPRAGEQAVPRYSVQDVEAGALDDHNGDKPVVIEGALANSVAVRDWSLDWFKNTFPNEPVHFSDWLKDTEAKRDVMANKISLADAIDGVRADRNKALRSCADIVYKHPHLLEDLGADRHREHFADDVTRTDLWLAAGGNISPFHTAGGGNLFCMVSGEKRWTLVSPDQSARMYPEIGRNNHGLYFDSAIPATPAPNLDSVHAAYPRFAGVTYLTAHLRPGDVLFNPPWWWHQVENLTETVAAAHRFNPKNWRPNAMTAYFYALCVASRPRFLWDVAQGKTMSDDATHLADHRLRDAVG